MKKKFFFTCYLTLVLLSNSVYAECPNTLFDKLHTYLTDKIPQITWLDINPHPLTRLCHFVIRYYPFNRYVQEKIDNFLENGISAIDKNCTLISKGYHRQEQGYGELEAIIIRCGHDIIIDGVNLIGRFSS